MHMEPTISHLKSQDDNNINIFIGVQIPINQRLLYTHGVKYMMQ